MKKIIFYTIFFLGLIIVAEVLYIFIKPSISSNRTATPVDSTANSSQGTDEKPTPTKDPEIQAVKPEAIAAFQGISVYNKGVLTSALMEYTLEGEIIDIGSGRFDVGDGEMKDLWYFEIKGSEGLSNRLNITEAIILKSEYEIGDDLFSGKEGFDLLKTGDRIAMTITVDVMQDLDYEKTIQKIIVVKK